MNSTERASGRRRRGMIAGAGILLISLAAASTAFDAPPSEWRLVDFVRLAAIAFLAIILALRSTTAFSLVGRNTALDDELTRANRASAARFGFWALLLAVLASIAASLVEPFSFAAIGPLLLAFGAVVAALRFAVLEGRGG